MARRSGHRYRPRRPRASYRAACARLGVVLLALIAAACDSSAASPFDRDAGSDAEAGSGGAPSPPDATIDDGTLGGPCVDDGQCDDGATCTTDRCDPQVGRCRFTPDHALCADDVYCDGAERCVPEQGCVEGIPVACSDDRACTIDACVEADRSCRHEARDGDGDGDSVWNCMGGGDCNDEDPAISSLEPEVCGNAVDDDCDQMVDEADCMLPAHDTCADAFDLLADGRVELSMAGLRGDYAASCADTSSFRDAVIAIQVPAGPPQDVEITATADLGALALASALECGNPATELGCVPAYTSERGDSLSRLRLRSLPPGAYPVYVFSASAAPVVVEVRYEPASVEPGNETCGTAAPLVVGEHQVVQLVDAASDVETACGGQLGDLLYSFTLAEPRDVRVRASSTDGNGRAVLSLRDAECAELTCRTGVLANLFAPRLAAGTYFVAVSATAPTTLDLVLESAAPSVEPAGENCSVAPPLASGVPVTVELRDYADDVQLGCAVGAADAAYAIDLSEPSDVLLLSRLSRQDTVALSLARAGCTADDLIRCKPGGPSPLRAIAHALPAASYRAVVESLTGTPLTLEVLQRRAVPQSAVPFADRCADAVAIPETGGLFRGTTVSARGDYDASCDLSNQLPGGAPDQMLKLVLTETKRVVFDMQGSDYDTLLDVRRGPECPGDEVVRGCAAGFGQDRSFLDLVLPAGEYFVQVDGYSGDSGSWQLDVFVADP